MNSFLTPNTASGTKKKGKSLKIDYYRVGIWAFATFLLDQASKLVAALRLAEGETVPVIQGVFHFTLFYNTGGVFGLLKGFNSIFIVFSVFFIFLLFFLYGGLEEKYPGFFVPAGLVAGGAAGNLIDRIRLNSVLDFIDFRVWPVFNLADAAITAGAGLAVWKVYKKIKAGIPRG